MEDGREDGKSPANSLTMSERKNKRKMRTPTRASGMAEMIYGDEMEDEEADEMPSQVSHLQGNITVQCKLDSFPLC
jgi:hypothetical protein